MNDDDDDDDDGKCDKRCCEPGVSQSVSQSSRQQLNK